MVPRDLIFAAVLAGALPGTLAAASLDAVIGKALFERNWVSAPASTRSDDGLGPIYDAPSCASCHQPPREPPDPDSVPPGMVVRLGNPEGTGDPVYGFQVQARAVAGQIPEANPDITWEMQTGGWTPIIKLYSLNYGPLSATTSIGLRRAPVLSGVGVLAQIPESEILKQAEIERGRGDGIAGEPAWTTVDGKRVLGRFGWKATQPDLTAQTAIAFSRDLGLSTALHPEPWGDCTPAETACRAAPHGAEPGAVEIAPPIMDAIVAFLRALPAPAPKRPAEGYALFERVGCSACHADLHLAGGTPVRAYTDLLLHNLGLPLNDGIKEGAAGPGQWRTAPLWNMAETLKGARLLHDGRARTIEEAIDWHRGEAAAVRTRFRALSAADKAALVAFVGAL